MSLPTVETVREQETIQGEIKTAARHSIVYGLGGVVAKAIGFFMIPFYTHYLSPSDYGLLEILDLSMSLVGMLLHMGIAPSLLRSYALSKTLEDQRKVVSTGFLFGTASGLLTFFAAAPLIRPTSVLLFGPKIPSTYLLLAFGSFVLSYMTSMPRTYLRALEASGTLTAIETGSLAVTLGLNIYFIAFLRLGPVGILLSSAIVNSILAVGLSAWTLGRAGIRFSSGRLKDMVSFGLPLIWANVAMFALNFSDRFFLQHLRSLAEVGVYAIGYKFAFMINYLLIQPFFAMWQARMYRVYQQPGHEKIFSQIFVLYSFLLIYTSLFLSLLSPEIVRLMAGSRFASSQEIIPVVSLAYVFYGIGYYLQLAMFLKEKTGAIGMIGVSAAIVNLILNYVLIQRFGMMGAAWATVIGFAMIAVCSYWFSERVMPLRLGVGRVAIGLAAAVVLYAVGAKGIPNSIGLTLLEKAFCLLVFAVLLCKGRILNFSEIATLVAARNKALAGAYRGIGYVVGR